MTVIDNVWVCENCGDSVVMHPDSQHESQPWTRRHIAFHEETHAKQLDDHGGNVEMHRMHLKYPALCGIQCKGAGR